jgi:16S rRNA processing protein RimM
VGDGARRSLEVVASRPHKGRRLVAFSEVHTRDQAEQLRGARLEVAESEVPEPPEGSYYFFQLEGCRCIDRRQGDLGVVEEVSEGGGGVLLLVRRADGQRLPVPFVESVIGEIDLETRIIDVDLPEGLVEACGSV